MRIDTRLRRQEIAFLRGLAGRVYGEGNADGNAFYAKEVECS